MLSMARAKISVLTGNFRVQTVIIDLCNLLFSILGSLTIQKHELISKRP